MFNKSKIKELTGFSGVIANSIPVIPLNWDIYKAEKFGKYNPISDELDVLSWCIDNGINWLIEGDKGLGKTMAVYETCANTNTALVEFRCSAGTTMGDILGKEHLQQDSSIYELGIIPEFVEVANHFGRAVLYLDEFNGLEPEIQIAFNGILDDRRFCIANGKKYSLKKDTIACIIATQNPSRYAGTVPLNEATRSRFMGDEWNYPKTADLKKVLDWTGIPEKVVEQTCQLAMDNIGARRENKVDYVLSIRDLNHFIQLYKLFEDKYKSAEIALVRAIKSGMLIKYGEIEDREFMRIRAEETYGVSVSP